jgi:hypothetical protein
MQTYLLNLKECTNRSRYLSTLFGHRKSDNAVMSACNENNRVSDKSAQLSPYPFQTHPNVLSLHYRPIGMVQGLVNSYDQFHVNDVVL